MADQKDINLYQGDATPKDIVLRDLPLATVSAGTTIYLYAGDATAKDIILRNPLVLDGAAPPSTTFGKVNISGTWKTISACYVNVSGTWKTVTGIFVNVSGIWKQIT
jgi:hypothetical protein